ncbi:MAG: hypothetical protein JSW30_05560, partial [Dehalococcoidia bacterium]
MKRTLLFLSLIVVLAALPFAAACAAEEPAAPAAPAAAARVDILIVGSGPGGAIYPLSCVVMTVINENVPGVR